MKRLFSFIVFCVALFSTGSAQDFTPGTKHKIAVFVPLYLDSAFDSMDNYRYAKNEFPSFMSPGLEFYEGVQLALDSLAKESVNLEVFVFDNKSTTESIEAQLARPEMEEMDLLIIYCNANEVRTYANFGLQHNIPVININLPNDGGVRNNPYYVMLNSTLKTQVESIYHHLKQYYSRMPIIVFRKKGPIEDMIRNYLSGAPHNGSGTPLRIRYVDLPENFSPDQLTAQLDSMEQSIIVAGSLNEPFGRRLALQLAAIHKSYPLKVVGMPTWDMMSREFAKPEYKDLEIIYCTPFYNTRTDKVSTSIINYFNTTMFARPSDMVMRGYEAAWRFGKMLDKYGSDLASNLTRREFNVFREFDIQPVMLNPDNLTLDYFENKKLYFLNWQNGTVKAVY